MGGVSVFMIRPVTIIVAIAVAIGALEAVGERLQVAAGDSQRAVFSQTCEHYRVRAGANPVLRGTAGDFVVFLAGACGAAEVSLDTGTDRQRDRAALLLSRIALLRKTVGLMNAERWGRGTAAERAAMPSPVTPSGEFLIAHRMGLMTAFDAWLDSGVDFSLASQR